MIYKHKYFWIIGVFFIGILFATVGKVYARASESEDKSLLNEENCSQKISDLIKNGAYDQAIKESQSAICIAEDNPRIYNDLGIAYACKGEYIKAIDLFKKAMGKEQTDYLTVISYNLATAYFYAGLLEEAKTVIKENKSFHWFYILKTLVISKEQTGKSGSNITLAATSLPPDTISFAPFPEDKRIQEQLAELENKMGGEKYYFVRDFPLLFVYGSVSSYLNLAMAYIQDKKIAKAKEYLAYASGAVKESEEYLDKVSLAMIYFNYGRINLEEKEYKAAVGNFQKTVDIFPELTEFHKYLGISYQLLHDFNKAKDEYNKALAKLSESSEAAQEIRQYLQNMEDVKNAIPESSISTFEKGLIEFKHSLPPFIIQMPPAWFIYEESAANGFQTTYISQEKIEKAEDQIKLGLSVMYCDPYPNLDRMTFDEFHKFTVESFMKQGYSNIYKVDGFTEISKEKAYPSFIFRCDNGKVRMFVYALKVNKNSVFLITAESPFLEGDRHDKILLTMLASFKIKNN